MSVNRLTLDTNILIYAIDRDAKDKHERAISIVDQSISLDCVLTLQALCEFYAAATRKKYATHDEASLIISEDFQDDSTLGGIRIRNPFYSENTLSSYFL
jgi:predicted nucleic acid-binding protein